MTGLPGMNESIERARVDEREHRVRELLSRMSLDEKIARMSGNMGVADMVVSAIRYNIKPYGTGGDKAIGVDTFRFTDGPRGAAPNHCACFPVSIARGAAWDVELEERIGSAIGMESRSLGGDLSGSVCVNLLRHPGWGRAQETYGEDSFHVGAMGAAQTTGLQRHVMACVKHFAANSIERSRFRVDVRIDERTLREVYLPHFKRCVDAGAACVMSAYNKVNGEYCGHNGHLLRDILKEEWGFDGFVISDFILGCRDGEEAILGGLDVEMPFTWRFGRKLKRLVEGGRAPEKLVDDAVARIVRQKLRFEGVGAGQSYGPERIACREHEELALEAACKGIVLLKNENSILPLNRGGLKSIAVIGELAGMANLGDKGSSRVRPPRVVTPLDGISNVAGGDIRIIHDPGANLRSAAKAAREADAVVVIAGLTWRDEGEYIPILNIGGDRENLGLPRKQEEMIKAVTGANRRCAVVLEGGSAITVAPWIADVPALMMAWYPGMAGGTAIAEILFGDVNPGGRLPATFHASESQLVNFDPRADSIRYGYLHGYRHFDHNGLKPVFPFGYGLSYSQYEYSNLALDRETVGRSGRIVASVEVSNAGDRAGEEVVQLYVGCRGSRVERAVRELKGFQRIRLEPGEKRTVRFDLDVSDLAFYDSEKDEWETEDAAYEVAVGPSSSPDDLRLRGVFRVS
ncbi:MAG TPA: glycoside hydrolase family 3 C-terminal domain-containing protein [Candidatus Brocadiia bacterium]|nr:glycoside hydrolase family 3 C-terminal domain-containing protein [Candidatus Brocadiia bacterium]